MLWDSQRLVWTYISHSTIVGSHGTGTEFSNVSYQLGISQMGIDFSIVVGIFLPIPSQKCRVIVYCNKTKFRPLSEGNSFSWYSDIPGLGMECPCSSYVLSKTGEGSLLLPAFKIPVSTYIWLIRIFCWVGSAVFQWPDMFACINISWSLHFIYYHGNQLRKLSFSCGSHLDLSSLMFKLIISFLRNLMESTSIPRILDADQSFADLVSLHCRHSRDVIPPLTPHLCERTFYHDRNFGKEELLKIWGEFPIEE